jgi:hypothetical protein
MCRVSANILSVRTCSSYHASGGTVHNVTETFQHELFDQYYLDYDVAVAKVRTELNVPIDSAMCVTCAAVIFRFI